MKFNVPDMSCGHCKASVVAAITAIDPQAKVEVDLSLKTVTVASNVPPVDLIAALAGKGFKATSLAN